jgi:hypothetical protein
MSTRCSICWLVVLLGLAFSWVAEGKDEKLPRIKPSKVDRGKSKEREKLFGKWMSGTDFKVEMATRRSKGEKVLYFECEGAKDEWRGIFVPAVAQEAPYVMAVPGEEAATKTIAGYIALGYQPQFVVDNKNFWCFTLSKGEGLGSEAAELAKLGISAPEVK